MLVDGSKSVADLIVNNIGAEAPRVNTVRKVSPSQAENAGGADNPRRGGEPTGFPVATTDDAGQAAARQRAARRDSKTTRDGESAKPVPQQTPTSQKSGGKTQKKSTGSTDNLAMMAAVATNPNNNVSEAGKKGKFAQLVSRMTPVRANVVDTKGLATQPLMGAILTQDAAKASTVVAKAAQTAPIIATTPTQVIKPQQVAPMQANAAAKTQDAAKAKSGKQVQAGNQQVETRQVAKPDAGTAVAVKPTATTVYTAQIAGATMVNAAATQTQQAGKPAKVPDGLNTGDTTSKGKAAGKGADSLKVAQASKTNAVVAARVEQTIQAGETSTVGNQNGSPAGGDAQGASVVAGPGGSTVPSASAVSGREQAEYTAAARQAAETPMPDQIAQAIRAGGARLDQQVVVRLTPPELGNVRVTLRTMGDSIRGVLQADNPETARRMEREAGALVQRLQDAGVQVRRMDVVLTRQDSGQTYENPLAHEGGHGRADESNDHPRHGPRGTVSRAVPEAAEAASEAPNVFGAGTINVRI